MMQDETIVRHGLLAVYNKIISEDGNCKGFDAPAASFFKLITPRQKVFPSMTSWDITNGRDLLHGKHRYETSACNV